MKKIGIFGGTFNPPHQGHLIVAEQARISLSLDLILFVPAKNPYHKKKSYVNYFHRSSMTELAIEDNKYFLLDNSEKQLEGNSYSYDTVLSIIEKYGHENKYFFIIGQDSLMEMDSWYRYQDFLKLVDLIVFKRGEDLNKIEKVIKDLSILTNINFIDKVEFKISSSFIRESVKNKYSIKYLLPDKLIAYIEENKLYGD